MSIKAYSQVTITTADLSNICVDGGYYVLDDIVISENLPADIASSGGSTVFIRIQLPANFEFKTDLGAGDVIYSGTDFTAGTLTKSTSYIELGFVVNNITDNDQITFTNLQIRANGSASSGNLQRVATGNDAVINGAPVGSLFGAVSSIESPSIDSQPTAAVVCEGEITNFNVIASGAGLSYQWKRNGVNIDNSTDGGIYSNFNSATLQINNVPISINNNSYSVEITGICLPIISSDPAILTVEALPLAPAVTNQNQEVCVGETVNAPVASGSGGVFNWYSNASLSTSIFTGTSPTIGDLGFNNSTTTTVYVTETSSTPNTCEGPATAVNLIVNPLPLNNLAVTPLATEVCDGGTLTFTINGSQSGVNYQLFDETNTAFSSQVGGNGGSITITTDIFTGLGADETITVRATNATTTCSVDLTDAETITINPLPSVTINNDDDGDNIICAGTTITFTAAGASTYQFFVNGLSAQGPSASANFATSSLNNGDVVTVTGTDASGCSASSAGTTIIVDNPPGQPTISSASATECGGNTVTITSTLAPNGGVYRWYKDGTLLPGETLRNVDLTTAAQSGNYTVEITDGSNTATCYSTISAPFAVSINPLPNATLAVSPSASEVCDGGTLTFTINGSQSGVNYQLFDETNTAFSSQVGGNGGSITITTDIFTGLGADETITVRATNATTLCTNDLTETETITINPLPSVTINNDDDGDNIICAGTTITFTAAGASTYQFFVNGLSVQGPSASANFATSSLNNGDVVTVTGTDASGCSASSAGTTIIVDNPPGQPTISSASATECVGNTVTITSTLAPNGGVYRWYKDGTLLPGETLRNVDLTTAAQSGNYTVEITDGSNTATCYSTISAPFAVSINPLPNATLAVSPSASEVCDGGTLTFTINGSQSGVNYQLFDETNTAFSSQVGGNGGSISITSNTFVFATFGSTETITVRAINATTACNDDLTDTEIITIYEQTNSSAGAGGEVCNISNSFELSTLLSVGTATGTWTNESATGNATFENENNPTTNVIVDNYGSYTFRWTEVSGTCSDFDEVLVVFRDPPIADAGPNDEFCISSFYTVTDAIVENNTSITWTHNGAGSLFDINSISPTYLPSPSDVNTVVTLTLTVNGAGSCPSAVDLKELTVNPTPTIPAFLTPVQVCRDNNSFDLTSIDLNATPLGGAYSYSGTGVSGTNFDATNSSVVLGPQEIEVTYTSLDGCVRIKDVVLLDVIEQPTADAGADEEVCENTAYTVSDASVTNSAGVIWTVTVGAGTLTDANTLTPTYTPADADAGSNITLTLTVDGISACSDAVDTKVLAITAEPTANAGADDEVCENTTYTVSDALATNDSGITWTVSPGAAGTLANSNTITPTYTPAPADAGNNVTLILTVDGNGSCAVAIDTKVLAITPAPTADAGANDETCVNAAFTVNDANVTNGASILWTVTSGGGTLTNETTDSPTYTPVSTDAGTTVVLTLTVAGNGTCASVQDTKELTITPAPTADAGANDETCVNAAFTVNDANVTNGASILWTVTSGGGAVTNETTDSPTYTSVSTDAGTTVVLTLTVAGNGTCASVQDTKELTITPAPTADAGANDETCVNAAFTVNDANVTNGASILWTVTSGGGTLTNETTDSPTYTSVSTDAGTTVVLTLTVAGNGTCATVQDTKELTITPAPTADAGANDETCVNAAFTVNDANVTNGASILWTVTSGGGALTNETTDSPTYTPVSTDAGTTVVLTLTVAGNGTCANVQDTKELTITPAPTADAGENDETCVNAAFTVNDANVTNGASILWTVTSGGGTLTNETTDSPTYTSVSTDAGTTVVLTLTVAGNGTCASVQDTKELTITPAPTADAGANDETCVNAAFTVNDAIVTNGASILWTVTSGGGALTNETTDSPTYTSVSTDAGTTVVLTLTVAGNGTCASVQDTKELTITPAPTADAGANDETCVNAAFTVNDANVTNGASILWTVTSGGGALTDETTDSPTYTPVSTDAGTIVVLTLTVAGNGTCATVQDTKELTITPAPTADAGANDETCVNAAFTVNDANVTNGASILWTVTSGGGALTNETTDSPTYTPVSTDAGTTVVLTLTVAGNGTCASVQDTKELTITPAPTADAGANDETCVNAAFTVNDANVTNGASILWTVTAGGGALTNETTDSPTYTPVSTDAGTTVVLTLTVAGNGTCASVQDTKELTITPAPTADAGANDETCVNAAFTVNDANVTNGASILWTVTSGGGAVTNETTDSPTYTPVSTDAGTTVVLTLTVAGNGTCATVQDTKELTIKPIAIITPVSDLILCPAEIQSSISFSADVSGGVFSWNVTNFTQLGLASGSGTGDFPSFTAQANSTGGNINSVVTIGYEVNGCISINESFTITTKPTPNIDDIADIQVCPGELVNIEFNANTMGEIFSWDNDNNTIGVTLASTGTGNISFTATENNSGIPIMSVFTYYATLNGCESITKTFTVTLNPEPVVNPITDIEVCSFDQIQTNFASNVTGANFSWTNDNTATGIAASGTGNINVNALENLTGANLVSVIQVRGIRNNCEGEFESFTVTVKPKPIINTLSDIEICSEDVVSEIVFSDNSGGNSVISWAATNANNIGLSTSSGTGSIPQFTAVQNSGTTNIISTITVTSVWDNCVSDQKIFRIILRPTPLLNTIQDISVCANEPILTNFTNSLGGITSYTWTNDTPEIGLASSGSGNLDFTTAENISGVPIVATITVTPFNADCVGPEETFTITLKPTPQISEISDIATCSEEFVSIPFNIDISGSILTITNSNPSITVSNPIINNNAIEFTSSINTSGADLTGVFELSSNKDGCIGVESFVVTLRNKPVVAAETDEDALCSVEFVPNRNFTHAVGSGNFFWEITNAELIGDGTPTSGAGNFPGFELAQNETGIEKVGYVRYYSERLGCFSDADSFKITLKPSPVILNEDVVFCPGEFVNVEFLANISSGTRYFWTNDNTTIGINNISGDTENTITPSGFTATNTSRTEDNIAQISVYGVTDGCQGPLKVFRIIVKPNPEIQIRYENLCDIENGVKLDFTSSYDDLLTDSIISRNWTILTDPSLTVVDSVVIFNSTGRKDIRLVITTALGCTFTNDFAIEVWNIEKIDFNFSNVSTSLPSDPNGTTFEPIITPEFGPGIVEYTYDWNFGDTASGSNNISTDENPSHNYQNPGAYQVTLMVTGSGSNQEDIGSCSRMITKTINIVESIVTFPYFVDFENDNANWFPREFREDSTSSWQYIDQYNLPGNAPDSLFFINKRNDSKVWGTVLNDEKAGYNVEEISFLNTSIFDISQLEKPMLAFDMWLDVENEVRAGSILEYSTDGINYTLLGEINEPRNWYNISNSAVIRGPGNELGYAWFQRDNEDWQWIRVAYPLDELKNNTSVYFRFTFRGFTNDFNSKGMAIDNFYIGERNKNVLIENFTNLNADNFENTQNTFESYLNDTLAISKDVIPLQFHTTYPRPDALSNRNRLELDARAAIYSINSSSVYVFDGQRMSDILFNEEYKNEIRARSLIDAVAAEPKTTIEISVDSLVDDHTVKFSSNISIDTAIANNQELAVYYFIVEKSVQNLDGTARALENVVIKTLPGINGHILDVDSTTLNESYEWKVKGINNKTQLAIVTVIQNLTTNEVIQTTITDIVDEKVGGPILSNNELLDLGKIKIYPNPSKDKFVIELPVNINQEINYMVLDNVGKIITTRTIKKGEQKHELYLNGLSSGMYHILFKDEAGNISKKKIVLID